MLCGDASALGFELAARRRPRSFYSHAVKITRDNLTVGFSAQGVTLALPRGRFLAPLIAYQDTGVEIFNYSPQGGFGPAVQQILALHMLPPSHLNPHWRLRYTGAFGGGS